MYDFGFNLEKWKTYPQIVEKLRKIHYIGIIVDNLSTFNVEEQILQNYKPFHQLIHIQCG